MKNHMKFQLKNDSQEDSDDELPFNNYDYYHLIILNNLN